jgi:hypothetical protein
MDLGRLRDSLGVLADKLPLYSKSLRDTGFSCCHVDEDWINQNCTKENIAVHARYLIEYAREALVSDSTSKILFEDDLNCRSPWLNELKARRVAEFGPINGMKSAETRHLVHLSPCLRRLSELMESADRTAQGHQKALAETFSKRREHELRLQGAEIRRLITMVKVERPDAGTLQAFYATRVIEALASLGARLVHTVQMYGPRDAVAFKLQSDVELVLLPSVSSSIPLSGSVGMGFRLTVTDALTAKKFESDRYSVLHLQTLLPQEMVDYGRFSTLEQLCLNMLAWLSAVRILLPDVLDVLRHSARN